MPIAAYRPDAQQWEKMRKDELDGHGGEVETSKLLHIHPGLVHMDAVAPPSEGEPQQRWQELPKGLFTGIDWYTAFPNHYQGYGASGSADKGRFLVDYAIKAAAGFLRQVKDDTVRPAVLAEFYDRAEKPKL
jgi:creatinine amidohydrolase